MHGGRTTRDGAPVAFSIDAQPVAGDGERLFLIAFVDAPEPGEARAAAASGKDLPRSAELEQELEATRTELQAAIRDLELAVEEQKVANEEVLSINEEYQSANEELLTSKEELQSLNEELTALNSQLQETLERHRTTANDLQNVLYSTDVATIFLDLNLNIRFFTPATRSLFAVLPGDVGRPLADLNSVAGDAALLADTRAVLETLVPVEREIEAGGGTWYLRRILPYRTGDNGVAGVVITFADITERRRVADELQAAKQLAERASVAKSRFLAAASHDLRQPLQTLVLLQGLLAKAVSGAPARQLLGRFDKALAGMSSMLDTLLDINKIEVGAVQPEMADAPIAGLLDSIRAEFTLHAEASGIALRVVPCSLSIRSDLRLLGQMIRNLVSNALKYTRRGKVLLGCRRHGASLSIQVWDTGIGIPEAELGAIFEEYHQLDNAAREHSRGLGLGLAIVRRLGDLLGHDIRVRSRPGQGSVFSIEVARSAPAPAPRPEPPPQGDAAEAQGRKGLILVIEDDPDLSDLLTLLLMEEGHHAAAVPDGAAALQWAAHAPVRPDLILADYNLPHGMNGVAVTVELRTRLQFAIPAIVLTGDISTATLLDIAQHDCAHLSKPVHLAALTQAIEHALLASRAAAEPPLPERARKADAGAGRVVFVVDDDRDVREALRGVLEDAGMEVEDYASCRDFLDAYRPGREACLVIDAYLPGMSGLELLRRMADGGHRVPAIMITGNSDVPMAVQAMKAGALDFIEKPVNAEELLACVGLALHQSHDDGLLAERREAAAGLVGRLTARQRRIMEMVLAGHPSKNIAADLGISQRTVENHRHEIMRRTGVKSLPALARLVIAAADTGTDGGAAP